MTTELVLLTPPGAAAPAIGRTGISSAIVVDGRIFAIDCGHGSLSALLAAGLDVGRLEAVFLTQVRASHTGDLAKMLLNARDSGGRAVDVLMPARIGCARQPPLLLLDDEAVRVTAVPLTRDPATVLAYRFDTICGSVVLAGDSIVSPELIAFARGADRYVRHLAERGNALGDVQAELRPHVIAVRPTAALVRAAALRPARRRRDAARRAALTVG
jgi:ribonuclease BN (tRNA processing enzyme)